MSSSKVTTKAGVSAVLFAVGAGLSACAYQAHPDQIARAQQLLPTEQYGVTVSSAPEQIALALHASGPSATQQAALGMFVSRWRQDGGGAVLLRTPGSTAMARNMQASAAAALVRLGVPRERLAFASYADARGAPLLVSYDRFTAQGPNCSGGWANLMDTGANTPYPHFGCAVTANIAAQVANPRDFLAPAVETPADNSRRQVVLGKYRQGLPASTVQDNQANGRVSDIGN